MIPIRNVWGSRIGDVSSRPGDVSSRIRSPQADERGTVRCSSACITVRGISTNAEANDLLCVLCGFPPRSLRLKAFDLDRSGDYRGISTTAESIDLLCVLCGLSLRSRRLKAFDLDRSRDYRGISTIAESNDLLCVLCGFPLRSRRLKAFDSDRSRDYLFRLRASSSSRKCSRNCFTARSNGSTDP